MSGGLLQLVAYGSQDVYLSGNPQITFFKVVYRRHTNFAIEAIEQTFLIKGRKVASRNIRVNLFSDFDICPPFDHRMFVIGQIDNSQLLVSA